MTPEGNPLTVATFNIRGWSEAKHDGGNAWEKRAPLTIDVIAEANPDCLGFQEFSGRLNAEFYATALDREGMAIHLGALMDEDRYNPVAYDRQRLFMQRNDVIWLSDSDLPEPSWGADETRSANLVFFEEKETGKDTGETVVFVNTHLDHKNELARVEGTKKILQKLERIDDVPVVVVADANSSYWSPHDHPSYTATPHNLFRDAGFHDAFILTHPDQIDTPPNTFHNYEGEDYRADQYGTWRTDWILYKNIYVQSSATLRDFHPDEPHYASDHYLERATFTKLDK